jgi:hypothetical protein
VNTGSSLVAVHVVVAVVAGRAWAVDAAAVPGINRSKATV